MSEHGAPANSFVKDPWQYRSGQKKYELRTSDSY